MGLLLLRAAGNWLAGLVWDTVKKMGESQTFAGPLWLWGGLLENDHLVREFLMEELRERLPMAEGRIPQISALDIVLKENPQAAGAP